jgi:DNA-directed RNA polymerase subunit RPC12/RpoP
LEGSEIMATCKESCIHYSVCGIWDRKVFIDYDNNILSDFSDLSNVEEYCRNYLSKKTEAEWVMIKKEDYWIPNITEKSVRLLPKCSNCEKEFGLIVLKYSYCPNCGAKMVERR